jgi:mannan endo-1,4-beta-mannosidase
MKAFFLVLSALALGAAALPSAEVQPRATSKSWAGSNSYFLIGLSDTEQNTWIANMASYGAKVVRIWVNAQEKGSCQKGSTIATPIPDLESTIGKYDDTVLDAIDKVLVKFVAHGLKALISPHDAANEFQPHR